MVLSGYALSWLESAVGGEIHTHQRDLLKSHDQSCSGLKYPWLPRKGGVSCPSDLTLCLCGVYFFNEGTSQFIGDCDWHWVCECCAAKYDKCPSCENDD